ncbi:XRN2 [Bugula neritina]|uniref:XRN2 n=1 Tax=Bugula neritina TaxID=10212 RepID=A0A7J7J7K4_BUGNE|nr:XRN2 [Bugula neritina]
MYFRTVPSPVPQFCDDIKNNKAIMVKYEDPVYDEHHVYPAIMLPGAKLPAATLKPEDLQKDNRGNYGNQRGRGRGGYRPQLGFTPNSGYRQNKDSGPANRMLGTSLHAAESSRNYGNSVPPPSSYGKISLYAFLLLPLLPLGINLLLTLELSITFSQNF